MTNSEALVKVRGYLTDYLPSDDADEIDEIIKALEQEHSRKKNYKKEARRWKRRYLDLRQRISKLEEQTRWIPCSERLPEENIEVLITTKWDYITIGELLGNNDWLIHEGTTYADNDDIKEWMPLPHSYKEGKE